MWKTLLACSLITLLMYSSAQSGSQRSVTLIKPGKFVQRQRLHTCSDNELAIGQSLVNQFGQFSLVYFQQPAGTSANANSSGKLQTDVANVQALPDGVRLTGELENAETYLTDAIRNYKDASDNATTFAASAAEEKKARLRHLGQRYKLQGDVQFDPYKPPTNPGLGGDTQQGAAKKKVAAPAPVPAAPAPVPAAPVPVPAAPL